MNHDGAQHWQIDVAPWKLPASSSLTKTGAAPASGSVSARRANRANRPSDDVQRNCRAGPLAVAGTLFCETKPIGDDINCGPQDAPRCRPCSREPPD